MMNFDEKRAVIDITFDPRVSGEIRRYHTWTVHREQSVGEHSWQIMRILLTVWPRAPRRMLVHAVIHDMPEMAGDVPYPFKNWFPELKTILTQVDKRVIEEQSKNGRPDVVELSRYETLVFKLCEWIEMWEYGLKEAGMGNKYAKLIAARMQTEIQNGLNQLDSPEVSNYQDARQHPGIPNALRFYMRKRLEMEGQL